MYFKNYIIIFQIKLLISLWIKKTEQLKFYISKKNNIDLLNSEEIDKLWLDYDEINLVNINSSYCETGNGEHDIIYSAFDNDIH